MTIAQSFANLLTVTDKGSELQDEDLNLYSEHIANAFDVCDNNVILLLFKDQSGVLRIYEDRYLYDDFEEFEMGINGYLRKKHPKEISALIKHLKESVNELHSKT